MRSSTQLSRWYPRSTPLWLVTNSCIWVVSQARLARLVYRQVDLFCMCVYSRCMHAEPQSKLATMNEVIYVFAETLYDFPDPQYNWRLCEDLETLSTTGGCVRIWRPSVPLEVAWGSGDPQTSHEDLGIMWLPRPSEIAWGSGDDTSMTTEIA